MGDGREALLAALDVRRYAKLSVAVGVVVALAVTAVFVWPGPRGTTQPTVYYLGLAFVLFVAVALLSITVLTTRRLLALSVDPATLVRRTATGGLLAGGLWLAGGGALLAESEVVTDRVPGLVLPWAPLVGLLGVWAVHTRYKRETSVRPLAVVGAVLALVGAVVVADVVAFDLPALLGDAPPATADGVDRLFQAGMGLLVAGHVCQAAAAALAGADPEVTFPLGGLPVVGVMGFLTLAAPTGLAVFAADVGLAWLLVGWQLRDVRDEEVPTGPAPGFGADDDAAD